MTSASKVAHCAVVVGLCVLAAELPARPQGVVRNNSDTGGVFSIVPVGDEVWLGSAKGAFRVDRMGSQAVSGEVARVIRIQHPHDEIERRTRYSHFGGSKPSFSER